MPTSFNIFGVIDKTSRILEEQEEMMSKWDVTVEGNNGATLNELTHVKTLSDNYVDNFVKNAVDMILSHNSYYIKLSDIKLYDTSKASSFSLTITKEEKQ